MTRGPIFLALLLGFCLGSFARAADEAAAAKEILGTPPAVNGLCVHLGAGSAEMPGLTAALAANSPWLVHGLALDEASLARARKAIAEKGVAGRAMVERVEMKSLPYMPDTANVLVVESPAALAAAGVTREEMLRVLAPDGVLCTLEGGKWTRTP